ncbi:MAG: alpha/beta hydrolase fold domain-containing protein [Erysipelotrichaceae bacterium]
MKSLLDVAYNQESEAQKLDLYYPETQLQAYPTVIYLHGGAFKIGDKASMGLPDVLTMRDHGFLVVSINYRLSGEARFPAAVSDAKDAVKFLKKYASTYKVDMDRIFLWGASAGANLAAMAALSKDVFPTAYPDFDSQVRGCITWFGPMDFSQMDADAQETGIPLRYGACDVETSPESLYLGQRISEDPAWTQRSNPETYIDETACPFLVQHGTHDNYVPYLQSVRFYNALVDKIGDTHSKLVLLEGASHGDRVMQGGEKAFGSPENLLLVANFMKELL